MTKLTWSFSDVLQAVSGQPSGPQNWTATNVAIDSRITQPGDLFIALKGPAHDGHDHVAAALKAGAVAAIVARPPRDTPPDAPLITVADTLVALEDLGCAGRARAKAKIIAVTGSVGKTGTKEMLRLMLSAVGETYANEGSFNNHWGVPLSLTRLPADAQYGVFELGMNHAGELGPLSRMVKPDIALITNIEAVHLEFFPSITAIADAKAEIFHGMGTMGTAVLNRDNPYFTRLDDAACHQGLHRIVGFGRDAIAEACLMSYETTADGGLVSAEILGRPMRYRIGALGEHLALNSLGALLAASMAGADMVACSAALANYRPPKGRGVAQTVHLSDGDVTIIDESYNASPVAVHAAIRLLGSMKPATNGRRIMVLGDMRELGDASPGLHAALAGDMEENHIDRVYCCGEMMAHLFAALPANLRGHHAKDSAALAPLTAPEIRADDIVTVKGSKTMLMGKVIDAIRARGNQKQRMAG